MAREPGWLQRVFDQNERDLDAFPEKIRRAAHERVYGVGTYDPIAAHQRAITAAEQRVVAAAVALRPWVQKARPSELRLPDTDEAWAAMHAAFDEFRAAVDALTALLQPNTDTASLDTVAQPSEQLAPPPLTS